MVKKEDGEMGIGQAEPQNSGGTDRPFAQAEIPCRSLATACDSRYFPLLAFQFLDRMSLDVISTSGNGFLRLWRGYMHSRSLLW
jgi:hypothetical protein